jgi:hypothetical protein
VETGALTVPLGQDPVSFIVAGGKPVERRQTGMGKANCEQLRDAYLVAVEARRAPSSFSTEKIHLRHLIDFLGKRAKRPSDQVTPAVIEKYVAERPKIVTATTVNKELQTISQMTASSTCSWGASPTETSRNPEETALSEEVVACLAALSQGDSEALPDLRRVVVAWADLPAHIRQAVLTLVDFSKKGR